MAFKEVASLDCDVTITLGGVDKKTKKSNPKQIEGFYLGKREAGPNKFDKNKMDSIHVFQTKDGNVGVWGKTDLNTKLSNVFPGTMVRASFTGSIPTNKGNDMLKFKVEVDDSNRIDVSDLVQSTGESVDSADYEETADEEADENAEEQEAPSRLVASSATAAERKAKVEALLKGKVRS